MYQLGMSSTQKLLWQGRHEVGYGGAVTSVIMTQYCEIKHKTSRSTDTIKGTILVIFTIKGKNLQVTLNCSIWI